MAHPTNTSHYTDDVADAELEQLLADAYESPPIPRSLLKRLDRAIEQEWGESPRLADSATARVGRSVVRSARWVRGLPIAAAVAIILVVAVVFRGDGAAFAWSQLVEVFAEKEIVQLESDHVKRWISMSEGLISERSQQFSRLLNVKQNVVLERQDQVPEIHRTVLEESTAQNQDQMVLAFLMGAGADKSQLKRLAGARVVSEQSQMVTIDGRQQIQLDVSFACDQSNELSLTAIVDPETRLPVSLSIAGDDVVKQNLSFSYPASSAAERVASEFPSSLPIVEVESGAEVKTAFGPSVTNGSDGQSPSSDGADTTVAVSDAGPDVQTIEPAAAVAPVAFQGAASKWQPVTVVQRSRAAVLQEVNSILEKLWADNGLQPVRAADDEELLRRIYLDLSGRIPSVTEVRDFLGDSDPQRYEQLVDRLLQSPDHATHLATMYRSFLIPEGVDLTSFGGVEAFDKWLSERFAGNDSYDEVVRSLLLAEGRLSRSGPLLFYSAARLDPHQLAARTSRVFLGMRLECAQCHNHPFEPWTQNDFWSYAAFFARISRPQGELEGVSTVMQVRDVERGEVMIPETEEVVAPRFLNSTEPLVETQADLRRQQLADWLTGADNPYFPRATANRVWGQMFGKGIVDPIDDFGAENPPVSPELLDALASHFITTGYDLRELFRTVALSRAYRLSSGADSVDEERSALFAQMNVKTLTAEQVYDCITVATMPSRTGSAGFNVTRFGNSSRDEFLRQFRTPLGRSTEYLGGIPQALTLMNGTLIDGATGLQSSGLLKSLEAPFFTNKQRVEVIYFATLSRQPTTAEWELLQQYIDDNTSGEQLKECLADVLWALLNSAEFTMNH